MTEEQLRHNIAKNIIDLRKRKNMTQSELAEVLNYSDKSVSKWERVDGTPDVFVLYKIAELFCVSLSDLIGDDEIKSYEKDKKPSLAKRVIIPLLSMALVFFIASLIFICLKLIVPSLDKSWLVFIFAIPAASIVLIVFTSLWWGLSAKFISITMLIWSITVSIYLLFKISFIFITAGIFQLLVILWFIMLYSSKKKKQVNEN